MVMACGFSARPELEVIDREAVAQHARGREDADFVVAGGQSSDRPFPRGIADGMTLIECNRYTTLGTLPDELEPGDGQRLSVVAYGARARHDPARRHRGRRTR